MDDDPARWLPNVGLLGLFAEEGPTEHIESPEPVEEWPVVEYLDTDPYDLIAGWRDAEDETPIMRELLADWTSEAEEEAA